MAVDRPTRLGRQLDAELDQAGVNRVVIRIGQGIELLNARRERSSRPVQGTPPDGRAEGRPGAAPGVSYAPRRSSSVFPDPSGQRSGLPDPLASRVTLRRRRADCGHYERL